MRLVKRTSLVEEVINSFVNDIQAGEFVYGEKLPSQEALSKKYNVSRIVIREALSKLSGVGMVTLLQGKGSYLNESNSNFLAESEFSSLIFQNAKNLKEVLEARQLIEKETSFLAALRRTEENLIEIKNVLDLMIKNKGDIEKFAKWDLEFHVAIAAASQNSILKTIVILLKDGYWSDITKFFEIDGVIDKAIQEHTEIYKKIETGGAKEASEVMMKHLNFPDRVITSATSIKK